MEWHSIKRFILESALQQPDLSRFDTKKRIQVHASANFMTVSTSDWLASFTIRPPTGRRTFSSGRGGQAFSANTAQGSPDPACTDV
jgi:hypothetical protein